jgi:hypothetical protein
MSADLSGISETPLDAAKKRVLRLALEAYDAADRCGYDHDLGNSASGVYVDGDCCRESRASFEACLRAKLEEL